jgi:hypothetical protein
MKICSKCKVEKSLNEFSKDKNRKCGFFPTCKSCVNKYYKINKEYFLNHAKEYRINNAESIVLSKKIYYEKNKKYIKEQVKKYRDENIENIKEYQKKYIKEYVSYKRKTDDLYKLSSNIRTLIGNSIKGNGYTKKSKSNEILGCTFEEFKTHIEKQFKEGMNWEERYKWHLDHIYPVSLAKTEEEIIKLNHYTNFQPLWAEDNLRKGNRLDY